MSRRSGLRQLMMNFGEHGLARRKSASIQVNIVMSNKFCNKVIFPV